MWDSIQANKERLDSLRPFSQEALAQLESWYDVELTYTSNAIEGNTLTRQETALVLEKGLTVRGKPLKDHQEAVDHSEALRFVRDLVKRHPAEGHLDKRPDKRHPDEGPNAPGKTNITEANIRDIHALIVGSTLKAEAGKYSQHQRRIAGSRVVFPSPQKIPALMEKFGQWLTHALPSVETALDAHLRLVSIHPFSDGNGRTARLLLNLLLIKEGYPPLVIRPEDRIDYLDSIEKSQLQEETTDYQTFMLERLNTAFDDYFQFLEPKEA